MTRTAGAPIGCQRPSRFWGLGCPKIFHEGEDTLVILPAWPAGAVAASTARVIMSGICGGLINAVSEKGSGFCLILTGLLIPDENELSIHILSPTRYQLAAGWTFQSE
ncbi:hypothetical protein [Thiolapillus sp.]|uniref:hypothetical protein n=1 Tax=Thiolapillus sp. TaxID=2017437 RepID=UPI003AF77313